MKNFTKSIYKIEVLIAFLIIILFLIKDYATRSLIAIIGVGFILYISLLLYKKKRDDNFLKVYASETVIIIMLSFLILISLLGIVLGYNKTLFSLSVNTWFKGVIPAFIVTIISEYLRFILIKNNTNEKLGIYIITFLMILFNIITNYSIPDFTDSYKIFTFICTIVCPAIGQELLASYMVYKDGLRPALLYKLIMNLYIYIIPIMTDLGDYLYSAIGVMIPFTIYMALRKFVNTEKRKRDQIETKKFNLAVMFVIIILSVLVILVSGIFKYQLIAIASGSMVPVYDKGDAVIFEKVEKSKIEVGDIIVYRREGKIIAHRVIKITENNEKLYFYTKGDANFSDDKYATVEDDVMGKIRFIIKYIGYPTVWINQIWGEVFER